MNVHSFLEDSARRNPQHEALVCGDERLTYGVLEQRASRLCGALLELGLTKQDRVAVHLGNTVEAVVAIFAIMKAGAVFVLLEPLLTPRRLQSIINDSGAVAVFTNSPEGVRCATETEHTTLLFVGDAVAEMQCKNPRMKCMGFRQLFENGDATSRHIDLGIRTHDICSLTYTSGSTGDPKGVTMSHHNVVSASSSILEYLPMTSEDTVLNFLPLASDYGLYNVLMPIRVGCRIVLDRPFLQPSQLVVALNREGVTGLPLTPTIVAMLRRFRRLGIRKPKTVRWITSTGQALHPSHSRWLRSTFSKARIFSMYGLTECKRVSFLPAEELEMRPTSVGKAMPRTKAYVVDSDGVKIDRAGHIGELVVEGPHVMQGYWNLPEETEKVLKTDESGNKRVLKTGDLFTMDEEGFLYFVSRLDQVIKSGGNLVNPREVEHVVSDLGGVCQVAAVAVAHEVLGYALRLFVVPENGATLTEGSIRKHCAIHLEKYMIPKSIEICTSLPRTVAGKIDDRALTSETEALQ